MKLILGIFAAASGLILISQADAQTSDTVDMQRGREVYEIWCAPCHAPSTANSLYPGTEALRFKYAGALPGALEERTDLTAGVVRYFVRNGVSIMPQFRKTEVDDADLAAISAYLMRNNPR